MQIIYNKFTDSYTTFYEGRFGLSIIATDKSRIIAFKKGVARLTNKYNGR